MFELLAGFLALLASAALSQFGVDIKSAPKAEREVHRVSNCPQAPSTVVIVTERSDNRC